MIKKVLFCIFALLPVLLITCDDNSSPNQPPILVISANPVSGAVPLSVNFTAVGQDPEGTALAYSWNFGDGKGTSAQQNPSYTYTDVGTFTATCTVTDSGSPALTATATVTVEVLANTPVLTSVSPAGCVMHVPSFTLTATGTDFQSGAQIVFNGSLKTTSYVSSKRLVCTLNPEDTIIPSVAAPAGGVIYDISLNVPVKVKNPAPSGGESNTVVFTIHSNYGFENPKSISSETDDIPPVLLISGNDRLNLFFTRYDDLRYTPSLNGGDTWADYTVIPHYLIFWNTRPYTACTDPVDNLYVAYTGDPWGWSESTFTDIWLASLTGSSSAWTTENLTSDWSFEPGALIPSVTMLNGGLVVMFGLAAEYGGIGGNYLTLMQPPWAAYAYPGNMSHGERDVDHSFTTDHSGNLHFGVILNTYPPLTTTNVIHFTGNSNLSAYSPTHVISASDGHASAVTIISDSDGMLYAFWLDGTSSSINKLYYSRSEDGGASWYKRKVLSAAGGHEYISAKTDSAGNVIIVFSKEDYGAEKVYFFRSIDHGVNWTAPKKVADPDGSSSWQSFDIDGSARLHVVWNNSTGVWYSRSVAY
jgi:PKD repeat protein